jgi:hypothetical protein
MRTASRTDETQAGIVAAMREMGASVYVLKLPVDLAVGWKGWTVLVEVKRLVGKRDPKPSRYTQLQRDFMATWKGGPVATVCDVDGAVRLLKSIDYPAIAATEGV